MAILIAVQQATPLDHSGRGPARESTRVREPAGGQTVQHIQGSNSLATEIGIRELLEAGVHFGHQTRRWNPKMRRFIFGERGGIHIIDLQKTERLLHTAQEFAAELTGRGGTILFVGTKKQARDAIKEAADSCRHALHRPALARRPPDQLPDHQQAHPAPARPA